jgi:Glycosyltransferase family 87
VVTQGPDSLLQIGPRDGILRSLSKSLQSRSILRLAGLGALLLFLLGGFRPGWMQAETDFPNYYTAAVAVRAHLPLHNYYDWTWFARQMNYAGNGTQLGAYSPQTPLTMLPMVPLAGFPPQTAKRIWLVCNLLFLAATVWMLSQITKFSFETIWLLAFCGYSSLRINFLLGQYYVFLLFLLTLAFYFLDRQHPWLGGVTTGIAFALKLYGGPFLLYFAFKRQWKALLGMFATVLLLVGVAVVIFGPADVSYYATQLLPRSLEVGQVDPYNPGDEAVSSALLRSLVAEPELNPHPLLHAPWLFFFLRSFISLAIVAFLILGIGRKRTPDRHDFARHDFAWFVIAVILLSTSNASYTYILLLLPLVLLLEESGPLHAGLLVAVYVLLALPLRPSWLFPHLWLLFALFIAVGWPSWRAMPRRWALAAVVTVTLISLFTARQRMMSYESEPAQHFERVAVQHGAIFSMYPVVSPAGLFYQSMAPAHYVLRWLHGAQNEELSFEGQALQPRLAPDGESIDFELVANRTSTMMRFDPSTRKTTPLAMPVPSNSAATAAAAQAATTAAIATSPNGKWIAFESAQDGPTHIWLRDLSTDKVRRLTGGNCNSVSPAWEWDSKALLFASDCQRAFGLPALYRARLPENEN